MHDKETALRHQDILHRRSIAFPIVAGDEAPAEKKANAKKIKSKQAPAEPETNDSSSGD